MVTEEGTRLFATKSTAASLSLARSLARSRGVYATTVRVHVNLYLYVWYLPIYRLLLAYTHTFHLFLFLDSFVYDGDECGGRAPSSLSTILSRSYPFQFRDPERQWSWFGLYTVDAAF